MTTVKITELTNIGANLATSTVVPVVNMAGTPTTQKTTVGNIANLILEGAGTDYPEASVALLAQTVSNAAQPNITSTGTLTGLTVSGNTNLGAVANVRITGGTAGQILSTDGAGNLSWASDSGGSYGNSNVAAYLPTYTGNVDANWVIASYFMGNAHNLTYLPGANVNGAVPYATTANAVAGGNVSGAVGLATYATTANSVAAANVSGLGNVALSNYDGNASNVLHGDGSWSADTTTYSNSNVSSFLAAYGSNTITTTGNVSFGNVTATNLGNISAIDLDGNSSNILYGNGVFDSIPNPFNQDLNTTDNVTFANITSTDAIRFSNSGNIVGAMGYAPNYVSIEGYGSNTVNITANDIYTWTFDGNGNLTIPNGGNINFVNTGGITQAVNEDLRFTVSDDEQDGWAIESIVNDGAGNNLTRMQVMYDGVAINTDIPTNNYRWDFRDTGEFDVPKSIRGPVGGNLVISIGDQFGSNTFIDLQTRSYVGDALISNIRIANPNVTVSTASGAYNWTFGDTGLLTFPGTPRIDTSTNNFEVQAAEAVNFEANTVVNIYTDTSNNGWQWQFGDDGNTGFPGNLNYNGIASPSPSINGFSSASFNMNLTADQVYMSDNAISTVGGTSNLILNTQYGTATDSFIQVPTFQDGGEELIIKNGYTGSLGIRVQTTTGNFTFIGNNFSVPGDITATNIGNIASTNYDGNASNVLYGNGSFAAAPSGSSYGDSNVTTLLSSFGSNTITTTGNVSVGNIIGNGQSLTGIAGSNVTGQVSNSLVAGTVYTAAQPNITSVGTLTSLAVSGNVTAQGVGTNLVRRANTIGGSNTVVTLDNLTALVGGTPTRLFIGAASSNMTMAGTSQTMISGGIAVSSWINVPIVTGVGNGFAMSGAISSAGDTVVLNVTDQGAGSGTWRVTGMIANTSANLYSVSIERLA